ncbi:MAG TPA: hypothetical protein VKV39_07335 [Candidatus Sulfotelmatobacter sp.]|nr:hypothetical protein [Candidatus Sulfotelmatobacter sp.]
MPCRHCIANAFDLQRARKVVTAPGWDDEHRPIQADELREMTVDGAVSAEEENCVDVFGSSGKANAPVDGRVVLEGLKVLAGTSQPEDRSGAHRRRG